MTISQDRLVQERQRFTHPLAFLSADTRGRVHDEADDPIRTCFERDGHRVLHAKPFRRLRRKTQVFFGPENDHITTRMDHSLYVATIARTICRALGLNDDLAYAAALGHDIGHSAFGHSGERILRRLLNRDHGPEDPRVPYHHEAQSLRVVDLLSSITGRAHRGLNLCYEVRDAIRCHCGEGRDYALRPRDPSDDRDPSTFRGLSTPPITLEGCVVRISDRIAYLGRDIEDASVALGDLPRVPGDIAAVLGGDNRQIINTLVTDVIRTNRRDPEVIGFSEDVARAMDDLRQFNYRHIYDHDLLVENRRRMDSVITRIFDEVTAWLQGRDRADWGRALSDDPEHLQLLARFVDGARYADDPTPQQVAVDWIALMTDGFAFRVFASISLPRPVV